MAGSPSQRRGFRERCSACALTGCCTSRAQRSWDYATEADAKDKLLPARRDDDCHTAPSLGEVAVVGFCLLVK